MSKQGTKKSNSIDMLHGPLLGKIVLFAIPLAIASILQQLLNSADSLFAGQYISSAALAAVGGVAPIISLFVALFSGLAVGVNVVIAVHIGHDDLEKIRGSVQTTAIVALAASVVVAVAGIASTDLILGWISMPAEAWADGALYLHVYFVGVVFLVVYNMGSAVLRAKGDTKRPLYALAAAAILNVILDYVAVAVLSSGVFGIAVATVVADAVCAVMVVWYLLHEEETFRLTFEGMHVVGTDLRTILQVGIPAAIQGAVFSIANLVVQGAINDFGSAATAGSSAAQNYEIYTFFLVNAFSQAAVTFVGQNYAARNYERCDKVMRICMGGALGVAIALCIIFVAGGQVSLGIFTADAAVLTFGFVRLNLVGLLEFMTATYEVTAAGMRGMGWSVLPTVVVIIGSCILRIVYVVGIFPYMRSFYNLMLIYPISWLVCGVTMVSLFFFVRKRAYAKQGL